jgi:hypothetical protein
MAFLPRPAGAGFFATAATSAEATSASAVSGSAWATSGWGDRTSGWGDPTSSFFDVDAASRSFFICAFEKNDCFIHTRKKRTRAGICSAVERSFTFAIFKIGRFRIQFTLHPYLRENVSPLLQLPNLLYNFSATRAQKIGDFNTLNYGQALKYPHQQLASFVAKFKAHEKVMRAAKFKAHEKVTFVAKFKTHEKVIRAACHLILFPDAVGLLLHLALHLALAATLGSLPPASADLRGSGVALKQKHGMTFRGPMLRF